MPKKKLLHIQLLPLLSGVQNVMLELLAHLDRAEYDIYVLSKPGGPLVDTVQRAGYQYLPVHSLRRNISLLDFIAFFQIWLLIRQHRFDIVHTHSSKTGFLGRLAARLAGAKKIVHTVHGFAFGEHRSRLTYHLYLNLERLSALFCDKVVFVNNFEREFAISHHILKPEKAVTIHNAVNLDKFTFFRRHYENLDKEAYFTFGSVLRFTPAKNIVNVIRIALQVCHLRQNIRFIFAGDGELFATCLRLIENEKMQSRILLIGWQSDVNLFLNKLDVFLLYSRWEGLPISILEAMANGLPIVSSSIKGISELVSSENGILIDVNAEDELVKVLSELPDQTQTLQRWSEGSRRKTEESFNFNDFIKGYLNVYES